MKNGCIFFVSDLIRFDLLIAGDVSFRCLYYCAFENGLQNIHALTPCPRRHLYGVHCECHLHDLQEQVASQEKAYAVSVADAHLPTSHGNLCSHLLNRQSGQQLARGFSQQIQSVGSEEP